ncbi:MAG: hypothetical protein A2Z16_04890 [Chloroflexi bacterium RBG_16_54_18]|nr:MAG: hypothetical protein A2Z16_04890 [Chloroflexi bacterium RBG_16_54_18]
MTEPFNHRLAQAARILLGRPASRPVAREIPALTDEEIAEARQFFPLEKFFIFGHARAGTTVFVRLIRLHPEVHCSYQAHFFTRPPLLESLVADREVAAWLKRDSNRWNRGRDLSPVILRAAADMILEREARRENKRIVGDKSPNNLLDGQAVQLVHKIYPDARLIYILRDGRDTILSHRIQAFVEFPERLSQEDQRIRRDFSRDPEPFRRGERSLFSEEGIQRAAEGWVRNVTQTHLLGTNLYCERYLVSRYEDLLAQPWQELTRLWDFLKASPPPGELEQAVDAEMHRNPDAEWQQQKAREIAAPVQRGRQGSWREMFTTRDRRLFLQVAGDTLTDWGYETS